MKLIIANKLHSSWSMRPWLLLTHYGIPFEEIQFPFGPTFDDPQWKAKVAPYNPAGKVPALADGDAHVWESIAIMEHIAEKFPHLAIWPKDPAARALARSIASEMHAGFSALRGACPCNLGKRHPEKDRGPKVAADVKRITEIWNDARARFGKATGKPYLFGDFTAADAMYAPVATRFHTYSIAVDPISQSYVDAIYDLPAFRQWRDAALKEPWVVLEDEADEPVLEDYRPHVTARP
ncbi:MAG: glutathione S-transferase family protein [Beijerinckiaceae bacterium]